MPLLNLILGLIALGAGALLFLRPSRRTKSSTSVQVLVLGDIGRSPRMQYHALSIAQQGCRVDLIGYHESDLLPELAARTNVSVITLSPAPKSIRSLPFIISGPLKVVWQVLNLLVVLGWRTEAARWLLVQNPPSIPTLAVAAAVCRLRGTSLLIDWHNYGWSILAGTRGASHPFVRVSKLYEAAFGRLGDANLTVTHAMAAQLRGEPYRVRSRIAVMHDRPAAIFRPVADGDRAQRAPRLARMLDSSSELAVLKERGTRLIVSSTSWTPDEDFQLLLDALVQYSERVPLASEKGQKNSGRSPLLAVITGKGPQKAMYEQRIAKLKAEGRLDGIEVATAFLPMEDYAALLALADLGVCLHMSSSGVDLPMKVVDMFGAGLPVVAYSAYESFPELVREGVNGRGFTTAAELSRHLERLLGPAGEDELRTLRRGALEESKHRWTEEWDRVVKPVLGFS